MAQWDFKWKEQEHSDIVASNAFFTRTTADVSGVSTYINIDCKWNCNV